MDRITLGMPGPWANSNYEAADHYTTKIGGLPDWPFPVHIVTKKLLECDKCGSNLSLIAQVYAPISSKALVLDERIIYIFGCLFTHCERLLWRALRVQKISSVEESKTPLNKAVNATKSAVSAPKKDSKDNLWSFDTTDSDESDDDINLEDLRRALSEATKGASGSKKNSNISVNSKKPALTNQPARSIDKKIPVIPCFYTYTQQEKLQRRITSGSSKDMLSSMKECENSSKDDSDGEVYEEESYEYDKAINADRTYLKFKKRIDAYPEQCFRYLYSGLPLLACEEAGDPGTCRLCGGSRSFEMQLMPPLIYFLQEAADDQQRMSLEKINWMTLLVYTCSKNCAQSTGNEEWVVAEESVIIQHDE